MPVILYRDKNYGGPSLRLQPGFYSGRRDLQGTTRGSSYGEDIDDEISSIRVDNGYIAVLYNSHSPTPGGLAGGARTLVGPTSIPDLSTVGMDDNTSSVRVLMYEPFVSAVPRDFGVTLFNHNYPVGRGGGIQIGQGDYDRSRLDSDEVDINPDGVKALCVGPGTIAILYEGNNFESTLNSTVVLPNECVQDTYDLRMSSTGTGSGINSIRVLYAALPEQSSAGSSTTVSTGEDVMSRAASTLGRPWWERRSTYVPILRDAPKRAPQTTVTASGPQVAPSTRGGAPPSSSAVQGDKKRPSPLVVMLLILIVVLLSILIGATLPRKGKPSSRREEPSYAQYR